MHSSYVLWALRQVNSKLCIDARVGCHCTIPKEILIFRQPSYGLAANGASGLVPSQPVITEQASRRLPAAELAIADNDIDPFGVCCDEVDFEETLQTKDISSTV
ncbi:hypothetical protein SeLEV6574_g07416 [Synchytrium endobioticum]|uniref:Uncharacterized protein n=1 Tax=Synchytrium endobioticum TaxID=286115 RepID=A0A507CI14_9FUNG|nr:hypothetical protein SeLEV6574_g07410 [Synchytrium endobioticum]TPX39138.1 hypothetical protein SeLEV6574_g07416 [Synchytrium endobioticum]